MKMLTAMGVVFLPSALVSSILGMSFFDFAAGSPFVMLPSQFTIT